MLRVSDIMTKDVTTVSPELDLRAAFEMLARLHVSGAPVVTGKKVVGVVSLSDLAGFAATASGVPTEKSELPESVGFDSEAETPDEWIEGEEPPSAFFVDLWADAGAEVGERFAETASPEWNVLEEHTVSEIMNRTVCSLSPDASVEQAAELMKKAGVHRILVLDGKELAGVVSAKDIADAVAEHKLTSRTYVFTPGSEFDSRGFT